MPTLLISSDALGTIKVRVAGCKEGAEFILGIISVVVAIALLFAMALLKWVNNL